MQVSVELDIAGESNGATSPGAGHWDGASGRTARAETSAPRQAAARGQNPSLTSPTDGSAGCAQVPSTTPPRGRSVRSPRQRSPSRSGDACSAAPAGEKASPGKGRQSPVRPRAETKRGMRFGGALWPSRIQVLLEVPRQSSKPMEQRVNCNSQGDSDFFTLDPNLATALRVSNAGGIRRRPSPARRG